MKKALFYICFSLTIFSANAQIDFKYRIINSIALTYEFITTPVQTFNVAFSEGSHSINTDVDVYSKFNGMAAQVNFQLNLLEFTNESALSLNIPFKFGISQYMLLDIIGFSPGHKIYGLGYIGIPLTLDFNYGLGSTYRSRFDHGLTIGAGIQLLYDPIITAGINVPNTVYIHDSAKTYSNNNVQQALNINKFFALPVIKLGYRFWTSKNSPTEVYFHLFPGSGLKVRELGNNEIFKVRNFYVSTSINYFLNY